MSVEPPPLAQDEAGMPPEDLSGDMMALLAAVGSAQGPVGTRAASRTLAHTGLEVSESTVSRRLRDLDELGLTVQIGSKGRLITAAGEGVLASAEQASRHEELLRRATRVQTAQDVLNLLQARRAVEPEAAREAATHATPVDIEPLRELVERHRSEIANGGGRVPRALALDFHRGIADLCRNPLLQTTLEVVLGTTVDRLEAALDVVLQTHHAGEHSVNEHARMLEALADGESALAESLMRNHLGRLVTEVEEFVAHGHGEILARLLAWQEW